MTISVLFAITLASAGPAVALAQSGGQPEVELAQQQIAAREAADHQRQLDQQRGIMQAGPFSVDAPYSGQTSVQLAQQQVETREASDHERQLDQQREISERSDRELRTGVQAGQQPAEAERQRTGQVQPAELEGSAQARQDIPISQPTTPGQTQSNPALSLLARAVGIGLLAGASAVLLGMVIVRRFTLRWE